VTSLAALEQLPLFDHAVVVAQTTQNQAFYEELKAWCAIHAPHYKLFDTICGSTEKRQSEVRTLARKHDAVIVVGGKQSGNTRRLTQVAREAGVQVTQIEDAGDIDYANLASADTIAITAGASTPNWIINDTCDKVERHLRHQHPVTGMLVRIREFLLKTNLLLAAGAGGLTYGCAVIQGASQILVHAGISMLYVLSMQILNNIFTIQSDTYNHPERAAFYRRHLPFLGALAGVSGICGLYLACSTGLGSFFLLLVMSLLGLSYNLNILSLVPGGGKYHRIKDIPGSKTILIVIAWGTVTSLLPAIAHGSRLVPVMITFIFSTGLVFARTAFFDILAIQGDRIAGKETLPILIGEKKSFRLIQWVLVIDSLVLAVAAMTGGVIQKGLLLAFIPLVMLLLIRMYKKESLLSGRQGEFFIESSFFLTGILALLI
jgi:4-hydroxy-3-methylbut-2-enyl diphosphate reductase